MKSVVVASLFLALHSLAGCDRSVPEPRAKESPLASPPSAAVSQDRAEPLAPADSPPEAEKFRLPGVERLVAIGDLHGDFEATQAAFRLAGATDEQGKWVGGKLVVVQTGDQLDRGDGEREILEFLARLKKEAAAFGGALHVLNGNHETMNVLGDFRYVTPGAMHSFDTYEPSSPLASEAPESFRKRAAAFFPGGGAALLLADQPLILVVGDTAFAHGGVLPAHVDYGIDKLNAETREWMLGERREPPALVTDENGPVWTRLYGEPSPSAAACSVLSATLRKLKIKRMAVGHTVQDKGMSAVCSDQVYRIDVGLAAYYGHRPVQVLEIRGDQVQILTAPSASP